MTDSAPKSLIAITGPTAVGKTDLALLLAAKLGRAEIISADSRQIYRGMDVGTAKPAREELEQVPHHLIDIVDPGVRYNAGAFAADSLRALQGIWGRGAVPIVVGGAGLYLSALLDGLEGIPQEATEQERRKLSKTFCGNSLEGLYDKLREIDPVSAGRISPHDERRIRRGLERAFLGHGLTGRWGADPREVPLSPVPVYCCLSRPQDSLHARIARRAAAMIDGGLLDEVDALVAAGHDASSPGLQCLGYAEALAFRQQQLGRQDLEELICKRTRAYAKRQLTWWARDRRLRWLELERFGERGAVGRILRQWDAEG
jgi:tRNA dimethylallyltransferase